MADRLAGKRVLVANLARAFLSPVAGCSEERRGPATLAIGPATG